MSKVSNTKVYQLKLWQKRSAEIKQLINEKLVDNSQPKGGLTLFEASKRASEVMRLFVTSNMKEADAAAVALIEELEAL